jgi:hypothetical protein
VQLYSIGTTGVLTTAGSPAGSGTVNNGILYTVPSAIAAVH